MPGTGGSAVASAGVDSHPPGSAAVPPPPVTTKLLAARLAERHAALVGQRGRGRQHVAGQAVQPLDHVQVHRQVRPVGQDRRVARLDHGPAHDGDLGVAERRQAVDHVAAEDDEPRVGHGVAARPRQPRPRPASPAGSPAVRSAPRRPAGPPGPGRPSRPPAARWARRRRRSRTRRPWRPTVESVTVRFVAVAASVTVPAGCRPARPGRPVGLGSPGVGNGLPTASGDATGTAVATVT